MADIPGLENASFKTADELKSLREGKCNRTPELLKKSEANQLYYKASPIDDRNVETMLRYLDEYANAKEAKNRTWIVKGLQKYTQCRTIDVNGSKNESKSGVDKKSRGILDATNLAAIYRQFQTDGSRLTFVDDVAMENLLRTRADEAKEKLRTQKYKKHMQQFLKVYQILKGGNLDYLDALNYINGPNLRESYSFGRDDKETTSFWELSLNSFPIKMETFAVNRRRLFNQINKKFKKAVVFLKGGENIYQYDSCEKYEFRQEPFFLWTFGATEPNLWGCLDCWTGKAILLCHRPSDGEYDNENKRNGSLSLSDLKAKYEVEQTAYIDQIDYILCRLNPTTLLLLRGKNFESGNRIPNINIDNFGDYEINYELYDIISDLRSIKTNFELDLMRYANKISSLAHRLIMKRIKTESYEYQAEALFKFFTHFVGGCQNLSYAPICSSGQNTADPEYIRNTRLIKCEDLVIFDMGASFYGYCSSIAVTIPAGGLFNLEQKSIYTIVLNVRNAALSVIKAGVYWFEVHDHAVRVLLGELTTLGVVKGELEDMLIAGVSTIFMPFGIGHFLGLNRYDVGDKGQVPPLPNNSPHFSQLTTCRLLQPGMVLALQVGCYFQQRQITKAISDPALKPFVVKEKINRFLNVGGVYLKDNLVITHQGYEMMTDVPRSVQDIEDWLEGKYDNVQTRFSREDKVAKDELWLGRHTNPCHNHVMVDKHPSNEQ